MTKVASRAAMLIGPVVAAFAVALAIYGTDGPPDNEQVNAAAQVIGALYGIYATVLVVVWIKAARAQ